MQDVTLVGLGWLGLPLYHRLTALGLSVAGTVTQETKCQQLRQAGVNAWPWQATGQAAPWPEELKAQTLILAIAPGRQDDYPVKIAALCQQAAAAGVQQLLYLSSTSVFAHQGEKDEQTVPVITSYSIHYTKLYDGGQRVAEPAAALLWCRALLRGGAAG